MICTVLTKLMHRYLAEKELKGATVVIYAEKFWSKWRL